MSQLTPMMQQYFQLKKKHQDTILFFRMGDFYEMFGEDARVGARELEIALTARNRGEGEKIPMAGVPVKAAEAYISRLLKKGYRVAIGEQLEDPKEAKGLLARDVVRVITPGTITDGELLLDKKNNYLAAVVKGKKGYGLAYLDISTGDFKTTQIHREKTVKDEILRIQPAEVLISLKLEEESLLFRALKEDLKIALERVDDLEEEEATTLLLDFFGTSSLRGFGLEDKYLAIQAGALILQYLKKTQTASLRHITGLSTYSTSRYMELDVTTRRNLELMETIREKKKEGSLLWVLDETITAMGGRALRQFLDQPLLDIALIEERLSIVQDLTNNLLLNGQIQRHLQGIYDLPRLMSRISLGRATGRDLLSLKESLFKVPHLKEDVQKASSKALQRLGEKLDPLNELVEILEKSIGEDPPATVTEGNLIKKGYHLELDKLLAIMEEGREWIAKLEKREREKTGIHSLKVGYNKVFGYYLEITKSNLHHVTDDYQRKQTLSNSERFITPELKEKEDEILTAQEKSIQLEYQLFTQIREDICLYTSKIQELAMNLAYLDVFQSLAKVAVENEYSRPSFNQRDRISITKGRHPVIEVSLPKGEFIPNDTKLEAKKGRFLIITGPNMSGKSTYMRQVALITLMAQIGSFVPARKASLRIIDRIFTRVGATDDLTTGQSTFMVEMNEVANIVYNSSSQSLILLDEVGRGTATFDGLSIAWAITEYLVEKKKGMTLFATHYHELTDLSKRLEEIENYRVAVQEKDGRIIFLHQIIPGESNESYGIEVARLAGLPEEIIKRAEEILSSLKKEKKIFQTEQIKEPPSMKPQLSLFTLDTRLREEIRSIDINRITPVEALNRLLALQEMLKEGD